MSFMRIPKSNGWIRALRGMFNFTNSRKMEIFKDILKAILRKTMNQYSTNLFLCILMPVTSLVLAITQVCMLMRSQISITMEDGKTSSRKDKGWKRTIKAHIKDTII